MKSGGCEDAYPRRFRVFFILFFDGSLHRVQGDEFLNLQTGPQNLRYTGGMGCGVCARGCSLLRSRDQIYAYWRFSFRLLAPGLGQSLERNRDD
jgi:hypothetical protein